MSKPVNPVRTDPSQPPRRESPPPSRPIKNLDFPTVPEGRLPNRLRVMVVTDRRLPRCTIHLGWPRGRVATAAGNLAVLPLAMGLVDRGTLRRDALQMARELDRFAIQLETDTLAEATYLKATVLSDFLDPAAELMSEMLREPGFPDEELEKLKTRMASTLVAQRTQPAFLARERAMATLFPDHPYSRVSTPLKHLQESLAPDVRDVFATSLGPGDGRLLFTGPLDLDEAMKLAGRHFGAWIDSTRPPAAPVPPPPLDSPRFRLVHRPHSVQAKILVGGHAPARSAPEMIPFRVANQILGGSGSSRLFLNLREDKGYTYGAYSSMTVFREASCFLAGADVGSEVAVAAVREVLEELRKMSLDPPADDELTRAQAEIAGAFIRQTETAESLGALELTRRLYGLPEDHYPRFVPRIKAVTSEQVLEISRTVLNPDRVVVTVVGDRDQFGPALEELGPVEVFDSLGEKL